MRAIKSQVNLETSDCHLALSATRGDSPVARQPGWKCDGCDAQWRHTAASGASGSPTGGTESRECGSRFRIQGTACLPRFDGGFTNPFFTTRGEIGTGLGLWVSAGIVDKPRGSMHVRSRPDLGKSGTTFTVILPLSVSAGSHRRRDGGACCRTMKNETKSLIPCTLEAV